MRGRGSSALGLVSVGVAALLLIYVRDFKRMFAFSTVEHMGIILVAAGLGGAEAHLGAAYQMTGHAIAKSFCFFAAGMTVMAVGTQEIASVRGLIRSSPLAALALVAGGFAIAGAPPFAVFVSEIVILKAGVASGQYVAVALLAFFVVIAFCAIMFHVNRMVFGLPAPDRAPFSAPLPCKATLAVAAIPLVVIGIYVPAPCSAARGGSLRDGRLKGRNGDARFDHRKADPAPSGVPELSSTRGRDRLPPRSIDDTQSCRIQCSCVDLVDMCQWLGEDLGFVFATWSSTRGSRRLVPFIHFLQGCRHAVGLCRCSSSMRTPPRCRRSADWPMDLLSTGTSARLRICSG